MPKTRPRPRFEFKSLSARIYFHGVALLVVTTVVLANVFPWATRVWYAEIYESFGIWITEQVCAQAKDLSDLQRQLDRAARAIDADATIHDLDGRVVASTVDPPLAPLPVDSGQRRVSVSSWDLSSSRLPDDAPVAGTIVWRRRSPPAVFVLVTAVVGVISLLVALSAIPVARSMARPLRDLRDVARRFGEGALATRARSTRADEIGDLARSFDEMAARIEASRRAERELLAGVSHELRTPLARIRVALDLVSEVDAASAAAHLPGIQRDLSEVERLLEDVLTAAKLDLAMPADAFPGLQKDVVLASELVGVVARRFEANHPARVLDVDAADLGETALDVDATLLGRALQNLLDNAVKYSSAPIHLDAVVHGERLTFRVIDKGLGISEADLALVFTPFFRGDPSRTRDTGGVGLGLALAKRIARAHGGDVAIESQLGKGTTVSMDLPVLGI
jgi:two-component system OmpR family sensor kinase